MTERVVRTGARVVLVDDDGRTLLFQGFDPAAPETPAWWFTPGGGVDPGESVQGAGRREVLEETGIEVADLGPQLREEDAEFMFEGRLVEQHNHVFCVRVHAAEGDDVLVTEAGWTDLERRSVHGWRWWTTAEIRASAEAIYPEDLADVLDAAHARLP